MKLKSLKANTNLNMASDKNKTADRIRMECEIEIISSDVLLWYRLSNGEEENWRGEGVANDFVKDCCMIKHNNIIDHKTKGEPIMSNDEIVQQVLDDLY